MPGHTRSAPRLACRIGRVFEESQRAYPGTSRVLEYLRALPAEDSLWKRAPAEGGSSFLARGEYSLNYLVSGEGRPYVGRLVTGTQMGLSLGGQACYEHHALALVAPSGVTPARTSWTPKPTDSHTRSSWKTFCRDARSTTPRTSQPPPSAWLRSTPWACRRIIACSSTPTPRPPC